MGNNNIVLSLFDLSGKMVKPWAKNGYDCYCVDIEDYDGRVQHGNITYIQADLEEWQPFFDNAYIVFGFPPCTDLAVSGARWWEEKRESNPNFQEEAMEMLYKVREVGNQLDAIWMVENPVGKPSTMWRKPDYYFSPYEYDNYTDDDNKYTKKTCLWTSDDFVMPKRDGCDKSETDERIHKCPPGKDRSRFRSMTPQGFANAVYEHNKKISDTQT